MYIDIKDDDIKTMLSALTEAYDSKANEVRSKESYIDSLYKEREALRAEVTQLNEQCETLKTALAKANKDLAKANEAIDRLRAEVGMDT